ncbi:hypothetical protein ACTG9Q_28185 [Actinokineospora sp. 24-640]
MSSTTDLTDHTTISSSARGRSAMRSAEAVMILSHSCCSPETSTPLFGEAARRRGGDGPLTAYLPSLGHLPASGRPVLVRDLNEDRAAPVRAASGRHPDEQDLALLDRVLHALRRL